jgi:hypothetical protein
MTFWSQFKPDPKWGVDDDDYDCMMLQLAWHWDAYTRTYNQYIVDRVKSNVLKAILPPEKLSKRKSTKRLGAWTNRSGISPDDKRPAYLRSITTYGDIFFDMPGFGYHREFVNKPGKKYSKTSSFVIWWECAEWMEKGAHPKCREVTHQHFYNSLACVYAVVEEARRRGDEVTFITTPGEIDNFIPAHAESSARRAPKLPAAWIPPPYYVMSDAQGSKRIGKWQSYGSLRETDDYTQEKLATFGSAWQKVYPHPDGLINVGDKDRTMGNVQHPGGRYTGAHEISAYYFWQSTTDYDDILNELLNFHYPKHNANNTVTGAGRSFYAFDKIFDQLPRVRKGTFLFVGALDNMMVFWFQYMRWRRLSNEFEFYYIDLGELDWTNTFLREPDFLDNGKPYIHYINISTVFQIGVSALGYNTFKTLHVDVSTYPTEVTVDFNDGQNRQTFKASDYPTIDRLEEAIQRAFPELVVGRITVPQWPTKDLHSNNSELLYPDGVITLQGDDVENFTYKLLRTMGGSVDGVRVV